MHGHGSRVLYGYGTNILALFDGYTCHWSDIVRLKWCILSIITICHTGDRGHSLLHWWIQVNPRQLLDMRLCDVTTTSKIRKLRKCKNLIKNFDFHIEKEKECRKFSGIFSKCLK